MIVWAVAATLAAIVLCFILIFYRRQVKFTCRQLAFVKENDTNMRLQSQGGFPELDTLRQEINEVLAQTKELNRETLRGEERFKETITNISHDIRTPLTSLDGYFQLLQETEDEEERARYVAIIKERISGLKEMLEELFTYTRLQNKSYELPTESVDFGKCVYETVFSFYDEFKKRNIEPEVEFTEDACPVQGNKEAFRRILQNILKNALEHGKNRFALCLEKEDGYVRFVCENEVERPGEINAEQVFERFYKADSARTHTSTGLGLSIAKNFTEKLNGTIEANLDGKEFRITVEFPLKDRATERKR
ncbi:MAG: HAMP domain-containing histidine kinase [Lachnospiraceae bacterium]|nr:HAMP domain-containing histidine kinase [Lachnospiraceae bacterium]